MGAIAEEASTAHWSGPRARVAERADTTATHAGIVIPRRAHQRHARTRPRQHRPEPTRFETRTFQGTPTCHAAVLDAAYCLRASVFMGELGWLVPSADGRERDRCDLVARHFVVFARQRESRPSGSPPPEMLVGYARVLLPRQGFMLEREFSDLAALDGPRGRTLDAERAFEVSRFVVHPAYRGRRCVEGRTPVEHLARAIARWAIARGRTDWYTVCEARYLRALRLRGIHFTPLGAPVEYQPGVKACAALLRLPVAAADLRAHRTHDFAWYDRGGQA